MAKQISQATFDDVVRENISEFEMSPEEAIEDAVQQFESQGVNLGMIVQDPSLYNGGADGGETKDHPVVVSVKKLEDCLTKDPVANDELRLHLQDIRKECDIELSRRCLAGGKGAYGVIFKALTMFQKDELLFKEVLTTFCSLVNGQPDLIDIAGVEFLMSAIAQYKNNAEIEELLVRAIRLNCIKHESNRQEFVKNKYIIAAAELLTVHKTNASLVRELCQSLRTLTLDDDVRVPFGKAHDTAKAIVTEGDALKAILSLCEEHASDQATLAELFLTLSCLAVRNEFCQEVMNGGGLGMIMQAFESGIKDKIIVRQALIVLKVLAGNDQVKEEVVRLGGLNLIVQAMDTHQAIAGVAEAACRLLTAVTLRQPAHCQAAVEAAAHAHVAQAMKIHAGSAAVQKQAAMALRNLVSRTKELKEPILALGVESLLNVARATHKDAADEAKAALRDLGCQVELKEEWKGAVPGQQWEA